MDPVKYPQPLNFLNLPGVVEYVNRADYKSKTGMAAPKFAAERAPQFWTSPESPIPNLPGAVEFPPAQVKPSGAHLQDGNTNPTITVDWLSEKTEARQLQNDLQDIFEDLPIAMTELKRSESEGYPYYYDAEESRRLWQFTFRAVNATEKKVFAGQLLSSRNSNGLGAPGSWVLINGEIEWQATAQVTENSLTPVPVPRRAPHDDEVIRAGSLGQEDMVWQKISDVSTQNPGVSEGEAQILTLLRSMDARLKAKGL